MPPTVTGLDMPPNDIDIDTIGIPALASTTCPSTEPLSNESGATGQQMTENIGLFLRLSSPSAMSDASLT